MTNIKILGILILIVSILTIKVASVTYTERVISYSGQMIKTAQYTDPAGNQRVFGLFKGENYFISEIDLNNLELGENIELEGNCIDFNVYNDFLILLKKNSIDYIPLSAGAEQKRILKVDTIFPVTQTFNFRNQFVFRFSGNRYAVTIPEDAGYRIYMGEGDKIKNGSGLYVEGNVSTDYFTEYSSIPPRERLVYEFKYLHVFEEEGNIFLVSIKDNVFTQYKVIENKDYVEIKRKDFNSYPSFRYSYRDLDGNGTKDLLVFSDLYSSTKAEVYFDGDLRGAPSKLTLPENTLDLHAGHLDPGKSLDLLPIYFIEPLSIKQYMTLTKKGKERELYFMPYIQWSRGQYKKVTKGASDFLKSYTRFELFNILNNFSVNDLNGDGIDDLIYKYKEKLFIHINGEHFEIANGPLFEIEVGNLRSYDLLFNQQEEKTYIFCFKKSDVYIYIFK